jgi:hypothetical protein
VHTILVKDKDDSIPIRNLYLMLHSCNYNVDSFIEKNENGEFNDYDGSENKTPEDYNPRSNVYVMEK